jgi:hypothetical protein
MPVSTTLPDRLRRRTVDVILETMTIAPLTRTALLRVAPDAYGDDPVYLTDAKWQALGPGPKVDLLLLCAEEDRLEADRLRNPRPPGLTLVKKVKAPDVA